MGKTTIIQAEASSGYLPHEERNLPRWYSIIIIIIIII